MKKLKNYQRKGGNINRKDLDPDLDHYRVCSDYFIEGEYVFTF